VWPIFDCYSNMPLFVYRIRDDGARSPVICEGWYLTCMWKILALNLKHHLSKKGCLGKNEIHLFF
jgi:hypothetical protein